MAAGSTQILPAAGHSELCRVFQRREAEINRNLLSRTESDSAVPMIATNAGGMVFVLLSIDARIGLWLLTQELHQHRPLVCILARFVWAMVPSQIEAWETEHLGRGSCIPAVAERHVGTLHPSRAGNLEVAPRDGNRVDARQLHFLGLHLVGLVQQVKRGLGAVVERQQVPFDVEGPHIRVSLDCVPFTDRAIPPLSTVPEFVTPYTIEPPPLFANAESCFAGSLKTSF